jgi:hypothetical protein
VQRSRSCRSATWSGSSSARATASIPTARAPTAPPRRGTGRPPARTAASLATAASTACARLSSSTAAALPAASAPTGSCTSTDSARTSSTAHPTSSYVHLSIYLFQFVASGLELESSLSYGWFLGRVSQGGYALCRVIKRHEAGLLQGEPAGKAKGGTSTATRGQMMTRVPSNSSLVSSDQLSTFTPANSSSPPPLDMMSRGIMCAAVAESCNNLQVRNQSSQPITRPPMKQNLQWCQS